MHLQQIFSPSSQTRHSHAFSPHTPFHPPFPVLFSAHWVIVVPQRSINPSSPLDNSKGPIIYMQRPLSCVPVIGLRVRTQTSLPTIQEEVAGINRAGNTSTLSLLPNTVLISMPIMPLTEKHWASGHFLLPFALQCSKYGDDS
jgi:hypothetical protein